jgi:DNA-binding HxlR family transcriptional regulator
MLAQTLQVLEADGLLVRHSYDVVPPHVDYTLSELGQEAAERVEALTDWIEHRMPGLNRAE